MNLQRTGDKPFLYQWCPRFWRIYKPLCDGLTVLSAFIWHICSFSQCCFTALANNFQHFFSRKFIQPGNRWLSLSQLQFPEIYDELMVGGYRDIFLWPSHLNITSSAIHLDKSDIFYSTWLVAENVNHWHYIYSISQEICTRFCCALLCCGYAIVHNEFTWSIYPYSSGLLCWYWGNR